MISGTLQLPRPDVGSLLGVQLAQRVNHEPEVHPLPCRNTQAVAQVTALCEPCSWGAFGSPGTGQCPGALSLTPCCATQP